MKFFVNGEIDPSYKVEVITFNNAIVNTGYIWVFITYAAFCLRIRVQASSDWDRKSISRSI